MAIRHVVNALVPLCDWLIKSLSSYIHPIRSRNKEILSFLFVATSIQQNEKFWVGPFLCGRCLASLTASRNYKIFPNKKGLKLQDFQGTFH